MFKDKDCDCECDFDDAHFIMQYDCSRGLQQENDAKMVQALYKQIQFQNTFEADKSLNPVFKKEVLYTNKELVNQIAQIVNNNNIDLPSSYLGISVDKNTNTILNAMQNRQIHLQRNPLG